MDPTSPAVLDAVGEQTARPPGHRPGARRRAGPVAVRGLDPRPRADPRRPQRRRPGRPRALGRRRHRRDDVRQPGGPRRRHRGRRRPARPPSWSPTSRHSAAPWPPSCPGSAPSTPRCASSAPPASSWSRPRTSRSCGCASWSSTTSTCWPASASPTSTPSVQRLLLDEEVRRLRAADPPPDLTLRTPDGDEWTVGAGTASVEGDRGALLGWLGRGLTDGRDRRPPPRDSPKDGDDDDLHRARGPRRTHRHPPARPRDDPQDVGQRDAQQRLPGHLHGHRRAAAHRRRRRPAPLPAARARGHRPARPP